jgi:hypothetical protein
MDFSLRLRLLTVVCISLLSGCHTAPPATADTPLEQPGAPVAKGGAPILIPTGPDNRGVDPDRAVGKSECANQLHDIEGALILYYSVHKEMPAKLEDLKSLADFDAPLKFTCPKSGEAYGYSPVGLVTPGKAASIVVYDASPTHNGYRWCILVEPSSTGAIVTTVAAVEEKLFQQYSPAAQ